MIKQPYILPLGSLASIASKLNRFLQIFHATVWRGPLDGDGLQTSQEAHDAESILVHALDSSIHFLMTPMLGIIPGTEMLATFQYQRYIMADARFGFALFEQGDTALNILFSETDGSVVFMGTIFRGADGRKYVLSLLREHHVWSLTLLALDGAMGPQNRVMVLGRYS